MVVWLVAWRRQWLRRGPWKEVELLVGWQRLGEDLVVGLESGNGEVHLEHGELQEGPGEGLRRSQNPHEAVGDSDPVGFHRHHERDCPPYFYCVDPVPRYYAWSLRTGLHEFQP